MLPFDRHNETVLATLMISEAGAVRAAMARGMPMSSAAKGQLTRNQVLHAMKDGRWRTTAEIMAKTGYSHSTISAALFALSSLGLVEDQVVKSVRMSRRLK